MRMAHGVLHEFDLLKESIEDFCEPFDFYCLANNILCEGKEPHNESKFFSLLFSARPHVPKLRTLVSPTAVHDLSLNQIIEHLISHYKPQMIKICRKVQDFQVASTWG